jgi:hypothetical protein
MSFIAYIDEAGDEGFTFRDPPERGSSEWFLLSAIVVRESHKKEEIIALRDCIKTHYKGEWPKLHFHELRHEQRAALSFHLSQRPFRIVTVCWNKRIIHEDGKQHTLDEKSKLHNYAVRYLTERLSWLAWDHRDSDNPAPMKLVFSKCKNLSYENLKRYFQHLRTLKTEIRWNLVNTDNFQVRAASELLGLKAADCVVSGLRLGLELGPNQLCIDTYCRHFKRITYQHNGQLLQYGLKIMPRVPDPEPQRDNRYGWIELYR